MLAIVQTSSLRKGCTGSRSETRARLDTSDDKRLTDQD
jgi:hypothetical protein